MHSESESLRQQVWTVLHRKFLLLTQGSETIAPYLVEHTLRNLLGREPKSVIDYLSRYSFHLNATDNNTISFSHFVSYLLGKKCGQLALQKLYLGDGSPKTRRNRKITLSEFHNLLNDSLKFLDLSVNESVIRSVFNFIGKNQDNFITFEQYLAYTETFLAQPAKNLTNYLEDSRSLKNHSLVASTRLTDTTYTRASDSLTRSILRPYAERKTDPDVEGPVVRSRFRRFMWEEMLRLYTEFDSNRDGNLDEKQMTNLLDKVLQERSQNERDYVFRNMFRLDINADGIVSYEQFAAFFLRHSAEIGLSRFHRMHQPGKRTLSLTQFITLFRHSFSYLETNKISTAFLQKMFQRIDFKNQSTITYTMYMNWVFEFLSVKVYQGTRYVFPQDDETEYCQKWLNTNEPKSPRAVILIQGGNNTWQSVVKNQKTASQIEIFANRATQVRTYNSNLPTSPRNKPKSPKFVFPKDTVFSAQLPFVDPSLEKIFDKPKLSLQTNVIWNKNSQYLQNHISQNSIPLHLSQSAIRNESELAETSRTYLSSQKEISDFSYRKYFQYPKSQRQTYDKLESDRLNTTASFIRPGNQMKQSHRFTIDSYRFQPSAALAEIVSRLREHLLRILNKDRNRICEPHEAYQILNTLINKNDFQLRQERNYCSRTSMNYGTVVDYFLEIHLGETTVFYSRKNKPTVNEREYMLNKTHFCNAIRESLKGIGFNSNKIEDLIEQLFDDIDTNRDEWVREDEYLHHVRSIINAAPLGYTLYAKLGENNRIVPMIHSKKTTFEQAHKFKDETRVSFISNSTVKSTVFNGRYEPGSFLTPNSDRFEQTQMKSHIIGQISTYSPDIKVKDYYPFKNYSTADIRLADSRQPGSLMDLDNKESSVASVRRQLNYQFNATPSFSINLIKTVTEQEIHVPGKYAPVDEPSYLSSPSLIPSRYSSSLLFDSPEKRLSASAKDCLRKILQQYDSNSSGVLQVNIIELILREIFGETKSEIEYVLKNLFRIDYDKDGRITIDHLCRFLLEMHCGELVLQRLHMDQEISRSIQRTMNLEEFVNVIDYSLSFIDLEPDLDELAAIFNNIDENKDGQISYVEYFRFVSKFFVEEHKPNTRLDGSRISHQEKLALSRKLDDSRRNRREPSIYSSRIMTHSRRKSVSQANDRKVIYDEIWQHLKHMYSAYETKSDNRIKIQDFEKLVKEILRQTTRRELNYVMWNLFRVEKNDESGIRFKDFAPFIINHAAEMAVQKFHMEQPHHKKTLNREEFGLVFSRAFDFVNSIDTNNQMLDEAFRRFEQKESGGVSYKDFLKWVYEDIVKHEC